MEKASIVRCALMQLTAMVYTILACATAVKINRHMAEMGYSMPPSYYRAVFIRDYGVFFLVIVLIWTVLAAYYSSGYAKHHLDEADVMATGVGLALLLTVAGTIIAFSGAVAPSFSLMDQMSHQ